MISSTVAAEIWEHKKTDNFFLFDGNGLINGGEAVYRTQGLTTDGQNWFFSWQYGLEKTTLDYSETARNGDLDPTSLQELGYTSTAIPPELLAMGSNHIGDIDYYKGKIYAPIEDHDPNAKPADDYQHPYIAVYNVNANPADPKKAPSYTGTSYPLRRSDLTKGVPWVAVDGCSDTAFTAEWNDATKINRYKLHNFAFKDYLMMDQTVDRIQGAKVHNGALYAATDGTDKTLYKIDLSNGHVDKLNLPSLQLNTLPPGYPPGTKIEVAGLSFLDRPEGSSLHVLRIIGDPNDQSTWPILHVALETYALVPTPIPAFNVQRLIIDQNRGAFFLWSDFTLGKDSNGINPVKGVVTLKIGSFTKMIPACSFQKNPYVPLFTFAGQIDNVWIEALITPLGRNRFGFQALAYGADLGDTKNNPVTVGLMIGDDSGTTTAHARTH